MNTPSRRDFLTKAGIAVGIGSAVVPLASLLPLAPPSASVSAAAAQETPELTDEEVAAFIESVELMAADAYGAATGGGKLGAPAAQAVAAFAGHHREHAAAFARLAGGKAEGKPHATLSDIVSGQLQAAPDGNAVLRIVFDLENAAAATYLYVLGTVKSHSMLTAAASFLPSEAQHAVVVGQLSGRALEDVVPAFENQDRALDPTKFPLTTTTTSTTTPTDE